VAALSFTFTAGHTSIRQYAEDHGVMVHLQLLQSIALLNQTILHRTRIYRCNNWIIRLA